ncbi:MAG TPA: flagellar biosynthesis anti-sigma factor FlgM [Candidatus Hydrogenedentes bacterium]|nr:flagellar biosynthesis anti-sigma factor FlgM [Candidatus Hydrogenedentota bacterium]HOL76610.1 flagellar biosynthesis anti-sigma factor FlgM [Candidatus Hydrogenedentota bacterium]HPO84443.1 flagellar biosynthesis anti-sigma factor FlgM [Candidatus Hydrogenedentota bacterium]
MAGIQGINGIPEPTPERPASLRKREEARTTPSRDDVQISRAAKDAANVKRLVEQAQQDPEIRMDRVAEAQAALENGKYKDLNVLREVARNLLKYLT